MVDYEKALAFAQFVGIVALWIRFESRLSSLEGRFKEFRDMVIRSLNGKPERR